MSVTVSSPSAAPTSARPETCLPEPWGSLRTPAAQDTAGAQDTALAEQVTRPGGDAAPADLVRGVVGGRRSS